MPDHTAEETRAGINAAREWAAQHGREQPDDRMMHAFIHAYHKTWGRRLSDAIARNPTPLLLEPMPARITAEMGIIRPGDTLIVRVNPGVSLQQVEEQRRKFVELVPDVNFVIIGAEQALIVTTEVNLTFGPTGRGHIEIGGHDISHMVTAVNLHAYGHGAPIIQLDLAIRRRAAYAGPAQVLLDDATRDALIDLGWTPPDNQP